MASVKKTTKLVEVRWIRPGSCHHGQVHRVSRALVDFLDGGRVVVWWPSRAKGKKWEGELLSADKTEGSTPAQAPTSSAAPPESHRSPSPPPSKKKRVQGKGNRPPQPKGKKGSAGGKGKAPAKKLDSGPSASSASADATTPTPTPDPSEAPAWAQHLISQMQGRIDDLEQTIRSILPVAATSVSNPPDHTTTTTSAFSSAPTTSAPAPNNFITSTAPTDFPATANINPDEFLSGDDVESVIGSLNSLTPSTSSTFPPFRSSHPPPGPSTPNRLHHELYTHPNPPTGYPPSTFSAPPITPPRSQSHTRLFSPPHRPGPSYQHPPYQHPAYQHPPAPFQHSGPAPTYRSPERVMAANQGRDTRSLRILAVKLARLCFFGDDLMATASPSGKGGPGQVLVQLEPQLMGQIKAMIRQRARFLSEGEYEALWQKCLQSISKACQNLRYGRLAKRQF